MQSVQKKVQLGQLLIKKGIITDDQLKAAIEKQILTGDRLGQVLVDLGFVKEDELLKLLAQQLEIPFIDVRNYSLDPETVALLPEMHARRYRAIVLHQDEKSILVAMADPEDLVAHDKLQDLLKKPIEIALASEDDLLRSIDMMYRRTSEITELAEELSAELISSDYDIDKLTEGLSQTDAPILKLLQSIFEDAVQVNASDIHIEPDEHVLRIRQRIDGVLHEQILKEKQVASALALRLKLMAGLNITEKRVPQDGRFSIRIHNKNFDIRLSTLPTQFGESVVMRLLNQSAAIENLEYMGMPKAMHSRIQKILSLPHGLLLVTGPTGSGKTTTLYSLLNSMNNPERKIITVEDPVEYRMSRINQVQVLPKIDLTFARVLRAILRQDPDVIMIGELRDHETAQIALRAAMTGHFVLATLHTNDATSSIVRLLDMGLEGYIVGAVLRAAIAQRLVRRICQNCIHDYQLTLHEKIWLDSTMPDALKTEVHFKQGIGCTYCHHTGFKGQVGIFEMLELNEKMADALRLNDTFMFAQLARESKSFSPLVHSGFGLVKAGVTTLGEIIRLTGDITEETETVT
ncbi:MAG: ATPase, T2SS/T4P/T4SS family [Gammaproteobacteria bacterium]|nr:ATPase, T2SS/T4P/T4SS family [Gammaproteobacteria bacterium]